MITSSGCPEDIQAEQSVLGAMLIEARAADAAAGLLVCSDFSRPGHQILFEAILALRGRGEPADFVTVRAELEKRGTLESVGGIAYLTALFDTVPTAANIEHYAKIVADKAQQRRLWEWSGRLMEMAGGEVADVSAFVVRAQTDLERIAQKKTNTQERRKPVSARAIDLADVESPGELPLLFGRYLLIGAAHWLTGTTGLGKSTFAYNVACALAEETALWEIEPAPCKVLYVDMESGDVGRALKVDRLYCGTPRIRGRLVFLREALRLPEELTEFLEYVRSQEFGLVIFDTARRCFAVKDENDNAEVYRQIVPTLDALKALGIATLTMGHPPKNGGFGARGAGAQEDAGDVNLTLTMHKGEVSDTDGVIALRVTKNRLLGQVPPLFLRRVGEDRFERIEAGGDGPQEEPISKQLQCREAILAALDSTSVPLTHGELMKAGKQAGFSRPTFDRAFKRMKEEKEVSLTAGGYERADPFADE